MSKPAKTKPPVAPPDFTIGHIAEFERLEGQLDAFYAELQTLVKKNPHDKLNAFKLALVNASLRSANLFLGEGGVPVNDFREFSDADLPSSSDVLFIVSQYLAAFDRVRARNGVAKYGGWAWVVGGKDTELRTKRPRSLGPK